MVSSKEEFTLKVYRLSKANNQSSLYLGTSENSYGGAFPNIKNYEGLSKEQFSKALEVIRRYRGNENELFGLLEKTLFD